MPAIDVTKAALEAAKSLNLDEKEEEVVEQPDKEEAESEKEEAEGVEKEEEGEEAEGEEVTPAKKPSKTIPIERFNEVYGKMKQMERALQWLSMQQQQPKKEEKAPEKEEPEPDFEQLTNKELAGYLLKKLGKDMRGALQEAVSPLTKFVGDSVQERANADVAACAAKHPDYFDYAESMMEIANKHRTLGAEEVYMLAKGDKASVAKSVTKRVKEKMQLKKKANVEKRSSPSEKISEDKEFKTVREAGLAAAKKLGLV